MHAVIEENDWSVTIYADEGEGMTQSALRQFFVAARQRGFSAASVGIYDDDVVSPEKRTAVPFVTVLHCDEEEARDILALTEIDSFSFRKPPEGETCALTCWKGWPRSESVGTSRVPNQAPVAA